MELDKIISKASNFLFGVFIMTTVFPFELNYSSIAIVALSTIALINIIINKDSWTGATRPILVLGVPLLVFILGLINTINIDEGLDYTTRNLSYLAFPLIFMGLGKSIRLLFILKLYVLCLVVLNLYLIYLFVYYFNFGERFYKIVTVDIYHSTYLGLYMVFGSWISYFFFKREKKWHYLLAVLFLFFGAVATSARIVILIALVSLVFMAFSFVKGKMTRGVLMAALSFLGFVIYQNVPSINQKFSQLTEIEQMGFDRNNYRSVSSRFGNIEAAFELMKGNFVFGVGTGDLVDELVSEYEQMNFSQGIKYRYNTHNQFLSNLVRNGLIGGGLCIAILYLLPLYLGIKAKNMLLIALVVSVSIVSITESFLDVHKGITFYAFFISLFLFNELKRGVSIGLDSNN